MNLDELRTKAFITVTEAADLLDMDERTVRRACEDGQILSVKVGRLTRIPVPKFLAMIEFMTPREAMIETLETLEAKAKAQMQATGVDMNMSHTEALLKFRQEAVDRLARIDQIVKKAGIDLPD